MDQELLQEKLSDARVARLATVAASGVPHIVPITFVAAGDSVVTAVDHKPKKTYGLRRLHNIQENPNVSLLVDHYADDWTQLWWIRGDGHAEVRDGAGREPALRRLAEKYPQYRERAPQGPLIFITVSHWTHWSYS
ncbi:PPOX class probable F420-dependent enzyme, Rv0121 family [Sinosporangium album]|uniref:PPOX class probable F420-dependent enzyme, Rv0121 family n=1 Tax=Sinosporangium album TaxID=504805 RepID=A0A1G8GVP9_9ACTN|nr:TIGR03668 family PPOX class F420-dependent oxidoreductase [Sinosporangium album]SDH98468.1 PPOX class probable F420-dependent enzyme, Rv0121 family [Sinosporangium album]